MPSTLSSRPAVTYDRYGFRIDGQPRFLLAGTVAYFRLAPADWRDRLTRLRDCGFNTVDVYVPWNFHEASPGVFDFTTETHDLAAYLSLCRELGIYVYFRPGPYICNEWDGGGLPGWLYLEPGVRLRQNDPAYLFYVRRYLTAVNDIARPYLHTNGGPIILYALENELDFYPCEDPHGYMSALRDHALAEEIDVPLTACIGNRTPIRAATGLVDGVLPTPNIYEGKYVERESAHARQVLHDSRYASGTPMRDVPAFVTEMGRDENSLKRILSTGYRGLGPFNFAGGANFGYTHAVNNWKNLSYLATSIDFGGMIGFDGRLQPAFYGARRVAGLIHAFEEEILAAEPITSRLGGPTCDNGLLGAFEDGQLPREVYSLTGEGGRAFIFLPNVTESPQDAHVQVGDLRFPRHSALSVAPGYTHVALANLPLDRHGVPARLLYSTAEIARVTRSSDGIRLTLCGERGAEGELCLSSDHPFDVVEAPESVRAFPETGHITLHFRFGDLCEATLTVGGVTLRLAIADREVAARDGLDYSPPSSYPVDLLAVPRSEGGMGMPSLESARAEAASKALEEFGVFQGAGWYEFTFELSPDNAGAAGEPVITLPHAGDLLTAFMDGAYCGTFVGDGGPLSISLPEGIGAGPHTLRLRAEIWGHSNFHDERWPSARLGSLRGVWGTPMLRGEPLSGLWRFAAETPKFPPPKTEHKAPGRAVYVEGGQSLWTVFEMPPLTDAAGGAVLTLEGTDCFGAILLGERVVGRYLFGPSLPVALTGGPGNRFFLPGAFLAADGAVSILTHGAGSGGKITSASLEVIQGAVT